MHTLHPEHIRRTLDSTPDLTQAAPNRTRPSVAMLLHGIPAAEIFFIVRAKHENDPWSGDIGFPGGKIETGESVRQTAERETLEEVSIDLSRSELLGFLAPIRGAHLPVNINCSVYLCPEKPRVEINHEVSSSFWYSIDELLNPERFADYPVRFEEEQLSRPGIRLSQEQPVLWGITYRLLEQFFQRMNISFPASRR
ncbi:MAG: CoA pyrophosphatase [Desulfuromonas sp.]|nr:MAG: CoA pyrophosphatase [Desulfuromonas sp.]